MASILVLYGTGEGQTAKVASQISESLDRRGHNPTNIDIEKRPEDFSLAPFDAVLVGSSIHVGKHDEQIREFVSANRDELRTRPTAFFQVSLSSAVDDPERRGEAADYVDTLLEETDWHPDRIGLFGGALRYSKYGFLKRLMMKQIAKRATGDVDTAQDYEYTDWAEVDAFTNDFAAFVESRLGNAKSAPGSSTD
jgi:menaquinone-dependent protoporphyrinogen oxidase